MVGAQVRCAVLRRKGTLGLVPVFGIATYYTIILECFASKQSYEESMIVVSYVLLQLSTLRQDSGAYAEAEALLRDYYTL